MRQFDRKWSLTVDRQDPVSGQLVRLGEITQLRISFKVNQWMGSVGNTGMIRVYNMPAKLRADIARVPDFNNDLISPPYTFVTLRAGYIDGVATRTIPVIMNGVVFMATNRRDGADWVTDIEANGFLSKGIGANLEKCYLQTPAITIVEDLATTMRMARPTYSVAAGTILASEILDMWAVSGSASYEINRLLKSLGLIMAADINGAFIMSADEGVATQLDPPYVYAEETGLIGVPEITRSGVKIRALLSTKTRLLGQFQVQSVSLEATLKTRIIPYIASSISHTGDTHGNAWYTDIEGVYPRLWVAQQNAEPPQ